ncbi:MAG: Wzz/FepE/Etk N-terminal domain-containing protein [candidate division Zixibacteria bacterium]|nr:Wzz/FepE/Etk N-terminal domain-containing protein [candidate division Zixibacteria bacterium]
MQNRLTIKNHADESAAKNNETTVFDLLRLFVGRKRLIGAVTLAVMMLTAVAVIFIPNRYRSVATILPSDTSKKVSALQSLADLTGMPSTETGPSQLYPTILSSQAIQSTVLEKRFGFSHDGKQFDLTLAEYFGLDNPDLLRGKLAAISRISADKKTGVVTLSVETTMPELSQAVAGQYLAQLEDFNRHQRRSQARENADYLDRQMAQTKTELETAEDELQVFRQYNSDWPVSNDAGLVKELSRLQRAVEVKTQTYLYLSREYESAQLEAQKDIPIVSILDQPSLPTVKSGPYRSIIVLLAGGVALLGTLFFLALSAALSGRLPGPHQPSWNDLRRETVQAFPRVTRLAGRLRREKSQPALVDD